MSEETMNKESATDLNEYDVIPDGFVTEKEMQEHYDTEVCGYSRDRSDLL